MSTVTAVGPAFPLVGPLPEPRPYSLLTVPGVIQNNPEEISADGSPRWLNQANVLGYPMGTPAIWGACSEGTFRVKDDGSGENDGRPQDRWDPFAAFFPLLCSTMGMGDYDEFYSQADAALDATLSHAVESVLATGVDSNPFFGDTGFVDLTPAGGAVAPRIGLSYLEQEASIRTGREYMIHATPAVVVAWGDGGGLTTGETIRTVNGTVVVSGSGYVGAHPVGEAGGLPGPDETTDWVFATGPVEVRIERESRFRVEESVDRSINEVVVRAERYVLAEWDKALQIGIRIDWSL